MPAQVSTMRKRVYKRRAPKGKSPPKYVKRYVGKAIRSFERRNVEHKFHVWSLLGTSTINLGVIYDLTQISQGLLDSARIGDQIKLSSFRANMVLERAASADQLVRVIFFQWGDSATPTTSELLQNDGAGYTHISTLNHDALRQRKLIPIVDRTVVLDPDDGKCKLDFNFLLKRRLVNYQNGSTNGSNKLYMYICTDQISSAPTFTMYGKLNYTDP